MSPYVFSPRNGLGRVVPPARFVRRPAGGCAMGRWGDSTGVGGVGNTGETPGVEGGTPSTAARMAALPSGLNTYLAFMALQAGTLHL